MNHKVGLPLNAKLVNGGLWSANIVFGPIWSSQASVETLSARFVSRLELVRTQAAEMTVAARPIVEHASLPYCVP